MLENLLCFEHVNTVFFFIKKSSEIIKGIMKYNYNHLINLLINKKMNTHSFSRAR